MKKLFPKRKPSASPPLPLLSLLKDEGPKLLVSSKCLFFFSPAEGIPPLQVYAHEDFANFASSDEGNPLDYFATIGGEAVSFYFESLFGIFVSFDYESAMGAFALKGKM